MNIKKNIKITLIILLLIISVNLSSLIICANNTSNVAIMEGEYKVVVNELYGSFSITEKEKVIFNSYPIEADNDENIKKITASKIRSALRVKFANKIENNIVTVYSTSASVRESGLKVFQNNNKTTLLFNFVEENVEIPLNIEVVGNKLRVYVDTLLIKEKANYKVYEIAMLPYMFGGDYDNEGSFILPDGSGAIMTLNQRKGAVDVYNQKIYSEDFSVKRESNVIKSGFIGFPVYAFIKSKQAAIAVISDGAADASLNAELSNGTDNYSYLCSNFILRDITKYQFADNRPDVDLFQETDFNINKIGLEYLFFSGENITYVDAANVYRNYLIKKYSLSKSLNQSYPFNLEVISATVKKDNFLGIPVKKEMSLTTFNQTKLILEELQRSGIKNVNISLKGWSKETIWEKPNRDIRFTAVNGGKSDFVKLQNYCNENDIILGLEYEINKVLRGTSNIFRFFELSKSYGKSINILPQFNININTINNEKGGFYFIKQNLIEKYNNKFLNRSRKLDIKALSLNDISIYKDFSEPNSSMTKCLNEVEKSLSSIKKSKTKIISNQAYEFNLANISAIFNMHSTSSNHFVISKSIPFFQIVLHGLINYSIEPINKNPNSNMQYLKAIETGSSLSYTWISAETSTLKNTYDDQYFYSSYDAWKSEVNQNYKKIENFANKISNQYIIDHYELEKEIYVTKYENNMVTVVNYNDYDVITEFGNVEAMGYLLIGNL